MPIECFVWCFLVSMYFRRVSSPVKWAGTITKSSVSQEEEFLLLPPAPDESFKRKPAASWVGEAGTLERRCWVSARDCCSGTNTETYQMQRRNRRRAKLENGKQRRKVRKVTSFSNSHTQQLCGLWENCWTNKSREKGKTQKENWARTGGEARWEVEELLQELADAELGKQVMVTAGMAAKWLLENFIRKKKSEITESFALKLKKCVQALHRITFTGTYTF